jgi:exodeoxyribonuclease V alpha subunit
VKKEELYRLYNSRILSYLDIHFARFMVRLEGRMIPELFFASALVSCYTRQGHICLDLSMVEGKQLLESENGKPPITCPKLNQWCGKLRESKVVGCPGEYKPLIFDDKYRLYLFRYWDYQEKLAYLVNSRIAEYEENIDIDLLKEGLKRFFSSDKAEDIDWQKVAAYTSLMKKFCVISGSPGTGKTTVVAKILALLLEHVRSKKLRIALVAPTGRAAAKLQEAIKSIKEKLNCPDSIKNAIPGEASTIHRLLGSISNSPYFYHNAKNTLLVDVMVVDEASMVDLPLMSKLIQALPLNARLILLGDKDQLASVEAGAILGDICDTGSAHRFSIRFCKGLKKVTGYNIYKEANGEDGSPKKDCIIQLMKSYRFGSDSGIYALSRAVNAGNDDVAIELLMSGKYEDIKWKEPSTLYRSIKDIVIQGFKDYLKAIDHQEIFQLFDQFRILCALREGPYGVVAINSLVEAILKAENLIDPDKKWYWGRPVLINSNDYNLQLFNGDVGIVLPDRESNDEPCVFFPSAEGSPRKFNPFRLPEHETVYATTVHKSQGSEFNKVLFLLPERDSPVLTRELIYTGITRAKKSVQIWGSENVFRSAISRRTLRTSGLRDALWTK